MKDTCVVALYRTIRSLNLKAIQYNRCHKQSTIVLCAKSKAPWLLKWNSMRRYNLLTRYFA